MQIYYLALKSSIYILSVAIVLDSRYHRLGSSYRRIDYILDLLYPSLPNPLTSSTDLIVILALSLALSYITFLEDQLEKYLARYVMSTGIPHRTWT